LLRLLLLSSGKFGGLFASLPNAMVSGLFCVMFGCICAGMGVFCGCLALGLRVHIAPSVDGCFSVWVCSILGLNGSAILSCVGLHLVVFNSCAETHALLCCGML
jgi:hypothetical protein